MWVEYVVLQFEDGKSHDIFGARTCRQLLRTRLTDAERCVLLLRTRPLAFELPSIHPTTGCRHFGARYGRQHKEPRILRIRPRGTKKNGIVWGCRAEPTNPLDPSLLEREEGVVLVSGTASHCVAELVLGHEVVNQQGD